MMQWQVIATLCAALTGAVQAQTAARFTTEAIEKGREQFHRTCSQCHGRNMVNAGTTVYDLRRFPIDDDYRFFNSVKNGKGNMPSFKGALEEDALKSVWAYVSTRGGKDP
jgi:mono/diheme cytochrome c family protein